MFTAAKKFSLSWYRLFQSTVSHSICLDLTLYYTPICFLVFQVVVFLQAFSPEFWREVCLFGTTYPHTYLQFFPVTSWYLMTTENYEVNRYAFSSNFASRKILTVLFWRSLRDAVLLVRLLAGTNISLSPLFSDTFCLRFSLSMGDQVSHTCKTPNKVVILFSLNYTFLGSRKHWIQFFF